MSTANALERVCARAWPPVVARPLGEWLLRAADGYTGRANSALAVGDPGTGLAEALAEVVAFSHEQGIPPAVQAVLGGPVDSALPARGWKVNLDHPKGAEVSVLTSPLPGAADTAAEVAQTPPPGWFELITGGEPTPAQRAVLTGGTVGFASISRGGELIGAARGSVVDGHLHIGVLQVRADHRGKGHAKDLLGALDAWAAGRGAITRVLQVAVHNARALALYGSLGYTESHRYRYWVPA
ncbi:GNAT family N-acetyltransferase [Actinokineospora pegani]|uniref:GNAT family N-acetyltransferase n=1 Tax=Actinokineospora pegani TaxID=2654637 RepID=UPI001F3B6B12|nr:GNAT family N-acetyltransferase [Actinokineospora pegani]